MEESFYVLEVIKELGLPNRIAFSAHLHSIKEMRNCMPSVTMVCEQQPKLTSQGGKAFTELWKKGEEGIRKGAEKLAEKFLRCWQQGRCWAVKRWA